jgi:Terminase large subunit, T4likevirus-type, N-terminal
MTLPALSRRIGRVEAALKLRQREVSPVLARLRREPDRIMDLAGYPPDPWQAQLLGSQHPRVLILAARQCGKSSVSACIALQTALLKPGSPVLLLSPSLRQSGELFKKIVAGYAALKRPVPVLRETALQLELANGSRIVSLPGAEETVRGFSGVALLVIDEASRVSDSLYYAVRPMLAVSNGRLVVLSTPFGQRGWFFDEWQGSGDWQRVRVRASECPRISKAFLAEERRALGERWYAQEYETEFSETVDAVFAQSDIQAALSDDVPPLGGG